jgi:hypothetical protein
MTKPLSEEDIKTLEHLRSRQPAGVVCVKQEHLQTLLDMAETHRAQMPTRSPTLRAQEDEAFQAVRALLEGGKQSHG